MRRIYEDEIEEIELASEIEVASSAAEDEAGLVRNATGRPLRRSARYQQKERGSLSVERGVDAGWTEEGGDKTGSEKRGQINPRRLKQTISTNNNGPKRDTAKPSTQPGKPSTPGNRTTFPAATPSFPSPYGFPFPPPPPELENLEKVLKRSPTDSAFPLSLVPNSPTSPNGERPDPPKPGSWEQAAYYYASYYMAYHNQMYPGNRPGPPPGPHMYHHPHPYPPYGYAPPPPVPYGPTGYYDDRYGPPMGYGMPYPPYYGPPRTGRSDASFRSPMSDSPPPPPPRRGGIIIQDPNRTKDGEHVPRPKNAFIFYRSHLIKSEAIPHSLEPDHRNLSRIAGEMWRKLSAKDRAPFQEMADREKEEHKRKYPNYRYSPAQRIIQQAIPIDGSRRRVHRRPEADAEEKRRCAAMADLVAQGITGAKLEEAMKEKGHLNEPASAGSKRKRRARGVESEDEDDSDPPQIAPAYRNTLPSVMRGPEPDKEGSKIGPVVQEPNPQYWPQSNYNSRNKGAQSFAPNAYEMPRPQPPATEMEPFQLLAEQAPNSAGPGPNTHAPMHGPQGGHYQGHGQGMAGGHHSLSPTQSTGRSSVSSSQEHMMPEGDMSYYLRGMHQMDGFVAAAGL